MKLLADFRARVLTAKVKKAAEDEDEGESKVIQEPVEQQPEHPSETEQTAAANEDW